MTTDAPAETVRQQSRIKGKLEWNWGDFAILVFLGSITFFASLEGARRIGPALVLDLDTFNLWFDGDPLRIFELLTARDSDQHWRTQRHPLFSLIVYPLVRIVRTIGVEQVAAVNIVMAVTTAVWIGSVFVLLRLLACGRLDALLFSLVAGVSAATVFWSVVPETFIFGSFSILLALAVVALAEHRKVSSGWYRIVSALTLSFTLTNWMAGILAAFTSFGRRRAFRITVDAFCIVVLLWVVQKSLFPASAFLLSGAGGMAADTLSDSSGGPISILSSFVFHSMVMPEIKQIESGNENYGPVMGTQRSLPGSGSDWGRAAVAVWGILLALGLWAMFSVRTHPRFRIVLALTILGQITLHLLIGTETFLYSAHFAPLLIILAALSTLTSLRPVALPLGAALIVTTGINNYIQFGKATQFVERQHLTEITVVKEAMKERPGDPWPRSTGHVVLATPGSSEVQKAYVEPGGSFSPEVGSFGVSIWLTDEKGNPFATSDTLPLNVIDQHLSWDGNNQIPAIVTESVYYRTLWSSAGTGHWTLDLKPYAREGVTPMLLIRSVGPAGGPIRSLDWNGQRLVVNDRWIVTLTPTPVAAEVGEEGRTGWKSANFGQSEWQSDKGWGYARFKLGGGRDWKLVIDDSSINTKSVSNLSFDGLKSALEIELPDLRFAASLNAQVAHLMMGLVGRETRPGDPTHYPLAWARHEAYIVAALARAGQLAVAKELSAHLAENDFFGGFGPEADAPGLAIWALEEIGVRLNQKAYDQWLWPHVRRKANLILQMLSADKAMHHSWSGPVIPAYTNDDTKLSLVAEPARKGLIFGKTERFVRPLFVSAVSYRGLLDAATLAERLNHISDAEQWRARAFNIKKAWMEAFKSGSTEPWANSIWATRVWDSDPAAMLRGLQARWDERHDTQGAFRQPPLRTQVTVAEAHQWLFFGREDRVWTTLDWLWNHQASPGLYTWWEDREGKPVKTAFRRWEQTRGWVNRPYITPQYQTAAEMLLLQLDMLAYVDDTAGEPTVVIGAGIPAAWLNKSMKVQHVSTRLAQVGWNWDGREMHVTIRGCQCKVQLGSVFSPDTPLRVKYLRE